MALTEPEFTIVQVSNNTFEYLGLQPEELLNHKLSFLLDEWKNCEIEAALELRSSIVGILLRKAHELAKVNLELEGSNDDLDSFAYIASHDLKEPLRGIHNYSSFLMEDYGDTLDSDGVSKLETLMRLTKRMENLIDSLLHYSRLGRTELFLHHTDLNVIVNNAVDVIKISKNTDFDIRIPTKLPIIRCDTSQISELFSKLSKMRNLKLYQL